MKRLLPKSANDNTSTRRTRSRRRRTNAFTTASSNRGGGARAPTVRHQINPQALVDAACYCMLKVCDQRECMFTGCDHVWIYTCDASSSFGSSLTVYFKFIHSQPDFSQITNLSDNRMCGRRSRDELDSFNQEPMCSNAPRFTVDTTAAKALLPAQPTLAWVAHGLWVSIEMFILVFSAH